MAEYPNSLPQPLNASLSNREVQHFRQNPTQTGPPRYEKLTSDEITKFTVKWNFSLFDFQVFESWFKWELNYGVSSFDIDLMVGMGLESHVCRFDSTYDISYNGKRAQVSATLVAESKQVNTESNGLDLITISPITNDADKVAFFELFLQFAETELPDSWETISYGTDFS